jgi:hypothetical protein
LSYPTATGAQAMIDDGLFDRFAKPDVILVVVEQRDLGRLRSSRPS